MSKNLNKNKQTDKSVVRARYYCPEELQEMIQLIRLLPPKMALPSLVRAFEEAIKEDRKKHFLPTIFDRDRKEDSLERVLREKFPSSSPLAVLKQWIIYTPQKFQDYIFEEPLYRKLLPLEIANMERKLMGTEDPIEFARVAMKYTDFCDTRESLQELVSLLESERERQTQEKLREWTFQHMTLNTNIKRGSDGKLHLTGLAKIIDKGFDDSRLRKCKKCEHIFWAKRSDSKTCSKQCLNAYNVQQYRKMSEEEKAMRKLKRQENKLFKEKPKSVKKIKDDTL